MQELGAQISDVRAAIGPGIGAGAYEVGSEVAAQFGLSGRACVDLAKENERQLLDGGLDLEQIWHAKRCTFSEAESFYSFRREGAAAGRMVSAIRLV
jgi:copper oxidase (laccase) domain-containing protein